MSSCFFRATLLLAFAASLQAEEGGQLVSRLGPSLICSGCKMAISRFNKEVARRMKAKMSQKKKEDLFNKKIERVCIEEAYGKALAIVEGDGQQIFIDRRKIGPKYSITRGGRDQRHEAIEVCKYIMKERRELLLKAVLKSTKKGASDINFQKVACLQAGVICNEAAIPENSDEEEEDEDMDSDKNPFQVDDL
mmetsp:Transcript_90953/g.161078  ORF Transcript_90953/g.161078 Transcript_90953/m.161078 type:complete len:193 (-) Transcript_90953:22-600(-)